MTQNNLVYFLTASRVWPTHNGDPPVHLISCGLWSYLTNESCLIDALLSWQRFGLALPVVFSCLDFFKHGVHHWPVQCHPLIFVRGDWFWPTALSLSAHSSTHFDLVVLVSAFLINSWLGFACLGIMLVCSPISLVPTGPSVLQCHYALESTLPLPSSYLFLIFLIRHPLTVLQRGETISWSDICKRNVGPSWTT